MKTAIPPTRGSRTAAIASSTDSSADRMPIRRTTADGASTPGSAATFLSSSGTTPPPRPPYQGGRPDQRDRGANGCTRGGVPASEPMPADGQPTRGLGQKQPQRRLVVVARLPSEGENPPRFDNPRIDEVLQIARGGRSDADPVQSLSRAERHRRGKVNVAFSAQPFDFRPGEKSLGANGKNRISFLAAGVEIAERDPYQCGNQVIDVAELPAGRRSLHTQQPRSFEVPGDDRVHPGTDHGRRAHDAHRKPRMGARGLRREP